MVIINQLTYDQIINFLRTFNDITFECETALIKNFSEIPKNTLRSILSKHSQNVIKKFYSKNYDNFKSILFEYERRVKNEWTIVEMAKEVKVPPLCICRMVLNEKFSKAQVKEMIKNPDLIPDPLLSANVL